MTSETTQQISVHCNRYGDKLVELMERCHVTNLNSYLTPDSERYESDYENDWLPDVDGSYGTNDSGIFFFTVDGKYIEWTGTYLYSDIPLRRMFRRKRRFDI